MSIYRSDGSVRPGRVGAYGCATALAIAALFVALWAAGVFTSGIRGTATVINQRNSGANRVAQNTTLNNDSAAVLADHNKILVMDAISHPTEQDELDLNGAEQVCASDVEAYNAAVANILAQNQLPANLPSSYDYQSECEPK